MLETATGMNVFAGRLLPHFYNYGSLQLYLVCFANTGAALAGAVDIVPKNFPVWYPQWAKMYLIGRCLTVGMGVGTVCAVYGIGTRFWGRRAGLLAALTLAIMPLHAQHSHFLTVDVPATFWGTLSLLWAARLATGGGKPWRAALWAGVFAGLATATKYNLALAILPLVLACVVRGSPLRPQFWGSQKEGPELRFPQKWGLGGLGLAAFVLAFFVGCPGALLESKTFLDGLRFESVHVQNVDDPTFRDTGSGFIYHIARNLDAGLGLPLLFLALVSVGYALYRRERGDGLLAAFALPYYVLISLAAVRYARYTIPLLPILALWVGRLIADSSRLRLPVLRRSTVVIGGSVLLLTLLYARLLILPMTETDPRDEALQEMNRANPLATVGFVAQPWFGTPPLSPYFSLPRPGGWREATPPDIMQRIVYNGKDWDADLLNAKKPDLIVVSEYDYDDALRLKDPKAVQCLQQLEQSYSIHFVNVYPIDPIGLFGHLATSVGGMPTRGLPHDMLYTNPYILIYQRRP